MPDRIPVRRAHLIQAFLLAPLAAPLTICLLLSSTSRMSAGDWLGIFLLYLTFAYAAELVLGTIAWQLISNFGLTSGWVFAAGGGLIAWLTVLVVMRGVSRGMSAAPPFVIAGIVSALLFRFVALRP